MESLFSKMEFCFFKDQISQALEYFRQLLDQLDLDDDDDKETLYRALSRGLRARYGAEFVTFLSNYGFDASIARPGKGGLALLYASSGCNSIEIFETLRHLGMDEDLPDRAGRTVLHVMAESGKSDWSSEDERHMAELVRWKRDLSPWMGATVHGATPLHTAVLNRHGELLEALLERGVDPNLRGAAGGYPLDLDGVTALDLACSIGDVEAARRLMRAGALDDVKDSRGRSAAHYALEEPSPHYCPEYGSGIPGARRVLERKAEILRHLEHIDSPDDEGCSPLLRALKNFRFDAGNLALILLEKGADATRADHSGHTPLMAAAEHYNKESLKALIAAGAPLDSRNGVGDTALHLALRVPNEKTARLLLKKGANPNIPNNRGETALDLAARHGMDGFLELALWKGRSMEFLEKEIAEPSAKYRLDQPKGAGMADARKQDREGKRDGAA